MDELRELGVASWLRQTCRSLGIEKPTPVQAATFRPALEGRHVLASSETGSGKTVAFALPVLQRLAEDPFGVFCVVVEPTRELALQVAETMLALGASRKIRVETVVGGVDVVKQGLLLSRRPHIVVGTPGRLAGFVRQGHLDLSRVRFVVLDEADRLLEECFQEDLGEILVGANPEGRQTLLFSATVSATLQQLADNFAEGVFRFDSKTHRYQTVEKLKQEYYLVPEDYKDCYLVHLILVQFHESSAVVFTGTKSTCEKLVWLLRELGCKCVSLHSGLKQTQREEALSMFKNGQVNILVATDLASRGLDVPYVQLVVNYDLPDRTSTYVHRVGRTARIGREGLAVSLVSQYDIELVQAIEAKLKVKLAERENAAGVEKEVLKDWLSKVTKARRLAQLAMAEKGMLVKGAQEPDVPRPRRKKAKLHGNGAVGT